jgi:hypothetical protein
VLYVSAIWTGPVPPVVTPTGSQRQASMLADGLGNLPELLFPHPSFLGNPVLGSRALPPYSPPWLSDFLPCCWPRWQETAFVTAPAIGMSLLLPSQHWRIPGPVLSFAHSVLSDWKNTLLEGTSGSIWLTFQRTCADFYTLQIILLCVSHGFYTTVCVPVLDHEFPSELGPWSVHLSPRT